MIVFVQASDHTLSSHSLLFFFYLDVGYLNTSMNEILTGMPSLNRLAVVNTFA